MLFDQGQARLDLVHRQRSRPDVEGSREDDRDQEQRLPNDDERRDQFRPWILMMSG